MQELCHIHVFVCDITCHVSSTPTLKSLHCLSVSYIIYFKVLLIIFKLLYGLAPDYISDLLTDHCTLLTFSH